MLHLPRWAVISLLCPLGPIACAENRALISPPVTPVESPREPDRSSSAPPCERDAGISVEASTLPPVVETEEAPPEFWHPIDEAEFAPYRSLAMKTFQMPDQPPAEVRCVSVTETDVLCRSNDFLSGITHHMGGPYFARMIGMHRGSHRFWIDVPISVSAHFSMRRASPTFVALEVQIAEGGRFRLIQSIGSCKGHGAKWGKWSDWRVVARKACEAEGVYEVKNGVLRVLPWTTELEVLDTDAPRARESIFD